MLKEKLKELREKSVNVFYIIMDVISFIIVLYLLIGTFTRQIDRYFGDDAHIMWIQEFYIARELGIFTIFPVLLYLSTLGITVLDFLMDLNIVKKKKLKMAFVILIIICIIVYPITWILASPWNTPLH